MQADSGIYLSRPLSLSPASDREIFSGKIREREKRAPIQRPLNLVAVSWKAIAIAAIRVAIAKSETDLPVCHLSPLLKSTCADCNPCRRHFNS